MRGGAGLSKAVVAGAGVVTLGLVAGCSGGDEAPPGGSGTTGASSATPSSSSSTATQSSTSTAAPEVQVPAAATKRTAAGAEAFARFYFESVGDAYVTGET